MPVKFHNFLGWLVASNTPKTMVVYRINNMHDSFERATV